MDRPGGFRALAKEEIQDVIDNPWSSGFLPRQEKGSRPSCALPYELLAEGGLDPATGSFGIVFEAAEPRAGRKASGVPFHVYAPGATYPDDAASYTDAPPPLEEARRWAFAVKTGDKLSYSWPLDLFEGKYYHLRTYGPNGFFREYGGDASDPRLVIRSGYSGGRLLLRLANAGSTPLELEVKDHAYGAGAITRLLLPGADETLPIDLAASHRWYDVGVSVAGSPRFIRRFAGRVETGEHGMSDPLLGRDGAATAGIGRPDSPNPEQRRE